MKEVTIRPIRPDEADQAIDWFLANAHNSNFDEKMLRYPGTRILAADPLDGSKPWLYVPIHPTYILDSIAPNPDANDCQIGLALRKITEIAKWEARGMGAGTVHFVPSEARIRDFAIRHESFFEVKMWRKEI